MVIVGDECIPFMIFCHHQRSFSKSVGSFEGLVRFTLKDTCIGGICLLDLANNDRLQFATRRLEVEVCLEL
jgi:hypothetical protein